MTHKNSYAGCSFLIIFKTLDPDSLEMLDLDPDLMNPDTQHCLQPSALLYF
jgi:hypothetical protein